MKKLSGLTNAVEPDIRYELLSNENFDPNNKGKKLFAFQGICV
jgi:hypothetical protein